MVPNYSYYWKYFIFKIRNNGINSILSKRFSFDFLFRPHPDISDPDNISVTMAQNDPFSWKSFTFNVTMAQNDSLSRKSFIFWSFFPSNLALVPIREPQGSDGKLLGNQENHGTQYNGGNHTTSVITTQRSTKRKI